MWQNRELRNRTTQICPIDFGQSYKRNLMEEIQLFQQTVLEQLDIHSQNNKFLPKLYTSYKH